MTPNTDSVVSSDPKQDSSIGLSAFSLVPVLARRLVFEFPVDHLPSLSTLRGIWGKVLHRQSPLAYSQVFDGGERNHNAAYVLRSGLTEDEPFVDVLLVGEAIGHDSELLKAWYSATEEGLGHDRVPFAIRNTLGLSAQGKIQERSEPWTLAQVINTSTILPHEPVRMSFPAPLRLLRRGEGRKKSTLIEQPTLPDLVVAACRRLETFIPAENKPVWEEACGSWLVLSRKQPAEAWKGAEAKFRRYSGSQKREVVMKGVQGELVLPEGLGGLRDLLVAVRPIHLGKGTGMGLGEMVIQRGGG